LSAPGLPRDDAANQRNDRLVWDAWMLLNNFQVQLATAYPGAKQVDSPKGRTLFGEIRTDHGSVRAFIKLLTIGDIAREAICAVLARKLRLPVPQPYYVSIDPAITDLPLRNHHNIAFALEAELFPNPRIRDIDSFRNELLNWPELYACAAFDVWIANRDRLTNNLLFAGGHDFWMIDHYEARPSYVQASSPVGSRLLELLSQGKSEFELYRIRDGLMSKAEEYSSIDWDEIRTLVQRPELPECSEHFDKYIHFLKERTNHMMVILTTDIGVKQRSLDFSGREQDSKIVRR